MNTSLDTKPPSNPTNWVYASLMVIDGQRTLTPSHASPDRLQFRQPPRLTSSQVIVILRNGDEEQRHLAIVLPHTPDATRIPIKLLPPE